MTDYERRKMMWSILSKIFYDEDPTDFIWLFSEKDKEEVNMHSDGFNDIAGVVIEIVE